MRTVHYLADSMLQTKGVAACGVYVNKQLFGDKMTKRRQEVTCGRCKRASSFQRPEQNMSAQQRCNKCKRIVGCDINGKKHKCNC